MVGSLLFTGLITLAASLGGLYNYSHGNISDNGFNSFGSHSSLYGSRAIQQALTPPSLYHYAIKFAPGVGSLAGKQLLSFYIGNVADTLPFSRDESIYTTQREIELEDDGVLDDFTDDDQFHNNFELLLGSPDLLFSNPFLYTTDSSPEFGNGSFTGDSVPILFTFNNNFGKYSYRLHFDFSSNTDESPFIAYYTIKDGIYTDNSYFQTLVPPTNSLMSFAVDPGVEFMLYSSPVMNESSYINSIYFERLITDSDVGFMGDGYDVGFEDGHTAGYHEGLDDANQPWTIMDGISTVAGFFLNALFIILGFEVFGIQLSYILSIIVGIVLVIWLLKVIRG